MNIVERWPSLMKSLEQSQIQEGGGGGGGGAKGTTATLQHNSVFSSGLTRILVTFINPLSLKYIQK